MKKPILFNKKMYKIVQQSILNIISIKFQYKTPSSIKIENKNGNLWLNIWLYYTQKSALNFVLNFSNNTPWKAQMNSIVKSLNKIFPATQLFFTDSVKCTVKAKFKNISKCWSFNLKIHQNFFFLSFFKLNKKL